MTDWNDQRILIIDDDHAVRYMLSRILQEEGFCVDTAAGRLDALPLVHQRNYGLVLIDIMLDDESGLDLIGKIRETSENLPVVMITGSPDVDSAAMAMRLGAFDYIAKPVRPDTLINVARHALKSKQLTDERERHRANLDAIFSSVPDAIIMADNDLRLIQFNASAAHACGYGSDTVGMPITEIEFGCAGGCRRALTKALETRSQVTLSRIECRRPDGNVRSVSLRATPVAGTDGTVRGAVAVIRDETLLESLERVLSQRERFHGIIGRNHQMLKLYSLIEALGDVQSTVLITGESGTGKELVAAALHQSGRRRSGPMVKVNCSAMTDTLLESELFGHVRGAFTGAISNKAGRFEKADGGTIFLDEIGDISPAMQMRLLRVLQEREVERVGDSTPIKVDVRVIAATNKDLAEMVRQGTFRQDLYFRINVVRLELPPLRCRLDDLPVLAAHFLRQFNQEFGKAVQSFSEAVMSHFQRYPWPGNVRQLKHVIEHACILCSSGVITMADLPQDLLCTAGVEPAGPPAGAEPPIITLEDALAMAKGNKSRAAQLLGISRRTIYRHLSQ